jgi:hypothetical protein
MKFLGFSLINSRSEFCSWVCSKAKQFSVVSNHGLKSLGVFVNTFRKTSFSSITRSISRIVPNILRVRAHTEVRKPIVECIPVDVVNNHATRNGNFIYRQDDSVDGCFVRRGLYADQNNSRSSSPGAPLKGLFSRFLAGISGVPNLPRCLVIKMLDWPPSPRQRSRFRIVIKTLAENFRRWQDSCRSHSGLFSLGFRWIWKRHTSLSTDSFTLQNQLCQSF